MTHYSIKEAAGFRRASDYVLKGIFNAYRKDPSFRKFYKLDDIPDVILNGGRVREANRAGFDGNMDLLNRIMKNRPSARSRRRAEFRQFKEQLSSRDLMRPFYPLINKRRLYIKGPMNAPLPNPYQLGSVMHGPGVVTGGFDPLLLSLMHYQGRAPRSWTQVLGHEVGHGILRDMNSRNLGKEFAHPFRRSVLKDYRTNLTPLQRQAALKYSVASGNTKALSLPFTDHRDFFRNPKKHAANLFQVHPELDERVADAVAMHVGQGNPRINRAIANHFNRYYRNVKGPVGWRARHLLRSE